MGILKKRGRPSKAEEIAKKEQEEAENVAAKKKEMETLRERLKGKTVHYKRDEVEFTFTIERVMFLYDGVCLTDGTQDGYSLTLLRDDLADLMLYGILSKELKNRDKPTSEHFILTDAEGQLAKEEETERKDMEKRPIPEAERQEQEPVLLNPAFSGQPGEQEKKEEEEPARTVKGYSIVLRGVGDVENAFLGMMDDLKDHGCAPMLVHRASKAADRLYDALYDMEKWYREKEGNA